jgi:hypothetical protein
MVGEEKTRKLKENSKMFRKLEFSWRVLTFTGFSPHTLNSTIAVSSLNEFFPSIASLIISVYGIPFDLLQHPSVAALTLSFIVPLFPLYASNTTSFNILSSAQCLLLYLLNPPQILKIIRASVMGYMVA